MKHVFQMKHVFRYLPLVAMLAWMPARAGAQTAVDAGVGFGTAFGKASGAGIDNTASANAFGACALGSGDALCQATPSLGGLFMNFNGDIMFNRHLGVGGEVNFQPAKRDYGPLQYRQTFVDGNVVYQPLGRRHWSLDLLGGIGAARTGFSFSESSCVGTAVCVNQTQPVGTATHFQVHTGVGLQVFLTEHLFVEPAFDYHYVPNLTQQFGSNSIQAVSFNIGYSSGRGQ
jgi:hypothetical protein